MDFLADLWEYCLYHFSEPETAVTLSQAMGTIWFGLRTHGVLQCASHFAESPLADGLEVFKASASVCLRVGGPCRSEGSQEVCPHCP